MSISCENNDKKEPTVNNDNCPSARCKAFRRLGDEFRRRYDSSYAPIDASLELGLMGVAARLDEIFTTLAIRLFDLDSSQPVCDWGRVIALVVFASSLALECHKRDRPHLDAHIRNWIKWFFAQNRLVRDWIQSFGGWVKITLDYIFIFY